MTTVILSLSLLVSLTISGILIWYVRQLLQRVWGVSENMDEVFDILKEYSKHIETVYGLETYHGDSVIENLLKHSQAVDKTLQAYIEAREIVQPPLEQEIDDTE